MTEEPQIQLRQPCKPCAGTGRIKAEPIVGGVLAPGSETQICRACNENGYTLQWVPVSALEPYLA